MADLVELCFQLLDFQSQCFTALRALTTCCHNQDRFTRMKQGSSGSAVYRNGSLNRAFDFNEVTRDVSLKRILSVGY